MFSFLKKRTDVPQAGGCCGGHAQHDDAQKEEHRSATDEAPTAPAAPVAQDKHHTHA